MLPPLPDEQNIRRVIDEGARGEPMEAIPDVLEGGATREFPTEGGVPEEREDETRHEEGAEDE